MGADMWGGGDRELYTKTECFLVSEWCSPHHTRHSTIDDMGSWNFPLDVVKKAHMTVPMMFDPDIPVEGYKPGSKITKDEWNSARQFLKDTAEANCSITGSY